MSDTSPIYRGYRYILDFSVWQNANAFDCQFQKLIDGLGLFYPKANME